MSCFKATPSMPPGDPSSWSKVDVKAWVKYKKLNEFKGPLAIDGKTLVGLTLEDLQGQFNNSPVPVKLLDAMNGLRKAWDLPALQKKSAPALEPVAAASIPVPEPVPVVVEAQDLTVVQPAAAEEMVAPAPHIIDPLEMTQLEITDRVTMESLPADRVTLDSVPPDRVTLDSVPERVTVEDVITADRVTTEDEINDHVTEDDQIKDRTTEESVAEPKPAAVAVVTAAAAAGPLFVPIKEAQGVQDWARALHPFTPDVEVDLLARYLESLGKGVGGGLSEAVAAQPSYGELFCAALELVSTAARAGVARENCSKAGSLADDMLRILDAAWRRMHSAGQRNPGTGTRTISEAALAQLAESMRVLTGCITPFTHPGWLLEVCCNERIKEKFDAAHNAVVDSLKGEGLDLLPGGKPLPRGDYRDLPRAVRRLVRQHGSGSITAGLMNLKAAGVRSEGLKELAALLELGGHDSVYGAPLVMTELEALPAGDLDVEVYYSQLVMGDNGGAAHHEVFNWYDRENHTGYIDLGRFQCLLSDLGMLEGKSEADAQAYVAASFRAADTKGQGMLGRDEFCAYYSTLTTSRARQQLRARMGLAAEEELRGVFGSFASFGSRADVTDIDNPRFYKLTRDCGLTAHNLTSTDVDLIFTKSKAKGARRMNFDQFLDALAMCADKKGMTLEALVRKVLLTGGPIAHATKPEPTRLHDDKSTYTGVYSKGGPRANDPPKNDLASLLDRSEADVRGVKKHTPPPKAAPSAKTASLSTFRKPSTTPPPADFLRTSLGPGSLALAGFKPTATPTSVPRRQSIGTANGGPADLREMFAAFATFGTATPAAGASPAGNGASRLEMDSSKFLKLCRECRLLDAGAKQDGFNATRADLIFAKVKQQGHTKISYSEFERALQLVAEAKGTAQADVIATVCNSDGPLLTRMVMQG